jgi:hypothetical protein
MAEVRRLLAALSLLIPPSVKHVLAWSRWRRQREAVARACHYQRRGAVSGQRPSPALDSVRSS